MIYYSIVNDDDNFYYGGYSTKALWGNEFNKAKIYKDIKLAEKVVNNLDNCRIIKVNIDME